MPEWLWFVLWFWAALSLIVSIVAAVMNSDDTPIEFPEKIDRVAYIVGIFVVTYFIWLPWCAWELFVAFVITVAKRVAASEKEQNLGS